MNAAGKRRVHFLVRDSGASLLTSASLASFPQVDSFLFTSALSSLHFFFLLKPNGVLLCGACVAFPFPLVHRLFQFPCFSTSSPLSSFVLQLLGVSCRTAFEKLARRPLFSSPFFFIRSALGGGVGSSGARCTTNEKF